MEVPKDFTTQLKEVDTLLLDLDQTLVEIHWPWLRIKLVALMMKRFFGVIPPHKMYAAFNRGIDQVRKNNSHKTNNEVFVASLAASAGCPEVILQERIEAFACHDFPRLKAHFTPMTHARTTLTLAQSLGLRLVVATNPTLPEKTVTRRIAWAGLGDLHFEGIMHSGIMTRSKPNPAFFEQLLQKIDATPEACLMVGDNPEMDLAASECGILTYMLSENADKPQRLSFRKHPELQAWGDYPTLQSLLTASRHQNTTCAPRRDP